MDTSTIISTSVCIVALSSSAILAMNLYDGYRIRKAVSKFKDALSQAQGKSPSDALAIMSKAYPQYKIKAVTAQEFSALEQSDDGAVDIYLILSPDRKTVIDGKIEWVVGSRP